MGHNTTSSHLVRVLRQCFCRTAVPDILWSDGGPQFTSKCFHDFSRQWGFIHKVSSPYYPQSNGKVEAMVKSMKKLIATSWNKRSLNEDALCRALLQYRNTPSRKDGLSLAQKLLILVHQCKTHSQLTTALFYHVGKKQSRKQKHRLQIHWSKHKHITISMPTHYQTLE